MRLTGFVLIPLALSFAAFGSISLSVVNDWITEDQVLGIDSYNGGSENSILAVCSQNSLIREYDQTSGIPTGTTIPLDPANTYPWGVVWSNDPSNEGILVSDMTQNNFYCTDDSGQTWTTLPNPTNGAARGMDFDGTNHWTTNGSGGGLCFFQPGGGHQIVETPEIPSPPSGLTVFPFNGQLGIAVTAYTTHSIFFYLWNGTVITFLGSTDCPSAAVSSSFGLAYAGNGNIFWTYKAGSDEYHLAELSFSIQALEPTTWTSIKTSF